MLPTERLDFSAIAHRPKLTLPDGARLVVWVIVNVEEWDPAQPMPRTVLTPPAGGAPMPDIPNWAWHEYGNRVGFWRMLEAIDEHRIRAVLAVNGSAIARYEPIARAALERGWEFIGHGFTQKSMQKVADERDDIRKTAAAIRDFTGKNPRGWLGPGPHRDLGNPRPAGRRGLRICLRLGARRRARPAQDAHEADRRHPLYAGMQRRRDDADPASQGQRVLRPSGRPVRAALPRRKSAGGGLGAVRGSARIMALVVHPYIMGAPHRLKYFRAALAHIRAYHDVLFWTGEEILDWYRAQRA